MKKLVVIAILLLAALTAAGAHAAKQTAVTVLLVGGPGEDVLDINLSQDGRYYLINSMAPLEAGGGICIRPEESHHELICEAVAIAGFEVNGGGGQDHMIVSPKILIPATLRGGPGDDRMRGGSGADKLLGGPGNDFLYGMPGKDWLFGNDGDDWLYGGAREDRLVGGSGADYLNGGPGMDEEKLGPKDYTGPMPHSRHSGRTPS